MPRPAPNQLPIDFETPQREAWALLVGALTVAQADEKVQAVVKLVYNVTRDDGRPLRWTLEKIGQQFCRSRQTVRRWIRRAQAMGLLTFDEDRYGVAGGQRSNQVGVDWEGVRRLAIDRSPSSAPPKTGVSESNTGVSELVRRRTKTDTPIRKASQSPVICHSWSTPEAAATGDDRRPKLGTGKPEPWSDDRLESVRRLCLEASHKIASTRPGNPRWRCSQPGDRSLLAKAACLALERFGEAWFRSAIEGVVLLAKARPWGYLHDTLKNDLAARGLSLHRLLASIDVPEELLEQPTAVEPYVRLCAAEGDA